MSTASPHPEYANEACPSALRAAESDAVATRRRVNHLPPEAEAPLVGFALSGGGIRSATFCLGLFQALARHRLIRRIDILSTVSGGGYFGSFLGARFSRKGADVDSIERDLANNQSWPVRWLRDNGRFLSPNGSGDTWMGAAAALRNWAAVHVVLLTFGFLLLGLAALIRTLLSTGAQPTDPWYRWEMYMWNHWVFGIWWTPWILLPVVPFVLLMVIPGSVYWLTQFTLLMKVVHWFCGLVRPRARLWSTREFAARSQTLLTRAFMTGLVSTLVLAAVTLIDSVGQTAYERWSAADFAFPTDWAVATGAGGVAYAFAAKVFVFLQGVLKKQKIRISFDVIALGLASLWLLLILIGLSVLVCCFAWNWQSVWDYSNYLLMSGSRPLFLAVLIALVLSWWFSRSFGFVNLSSLQQVYAARIRRAYIGASNEARHQSHNYSMTDLLPGDDLSLEDYQPHRQGGPLHLINVTINETLSGKTQIERRDRKGLNLAIGPCGLSVGTHSHALWTSEQHPDVSRSGMLQALFEDSTRTMRPITASDKADGFHALKECQSTGKSASEPSDEIQKVEALSVGRWVAISGAAFSTGIGSGTRLGLSLLLGLANVRLGYWWDSGITPRKCNQTTPSTFVETSARFLSRLLPVQMCLLNEFFARFHGPARRHWYLSDGGHFENTACYELIRRRVPFIICSDAGQDPRYQFGDLATLARIARTDFGAEIQIARNEKNTLKDDPDERYPMPTLDELVHPALLDVIGSPCDFPPLAESDEEDGDAATPASAGCHALLARIHYLDTHQFSWLLLIKPSLMGDEAVDVVQYQRTHPLFPQEPTSDQYFDEAQWESYRKLGEHVGAEIFTPPSDPGKGWSPSQFCAPPWKPAAKPIAASS